ncbi:MAG TPA: FMN-dependent NADH-azoreductase [Candidatus Sulfotelmatobacter sp.]|jgi:FMN-dependent NADH-azoreductase|nr:FMN-dependent NADH-azoreductase [Candidatus Sulfotelmatobacter sp.]
MAKVLHIDSSPLGDLSVSRVLTADVVKAWKAAKPADQIVYRDVAASTPDHLTAELLQVVKFRNLDNLTPRQKEELALTDALVDELLASDVLVIGAPMYNFTIPTQLKAWIDRICQAGRTFNYTANGPVGLATGKKVIIVSTRGGVYSTSDFGRSLDHQEAYLKTVLAFIGITDVTFVRAEGVSMGPEAKDKALAAAHADIAKAIAA